MGEESTEPTVVTSDSIEAAIELEEIDRDLYRSKQLWKPSNGRGVFGGQIIAQSLWAATLSVRRDEPGNEKGLHSLHSYFLNFGNAEIPVLYHVERLRDGRSYSTRTVLATQLGVPIFTITCSFCLPEPLQPIAAFPMPAWPLRTGGGAVGGIVGKIPEPEECMATEDRMQSVLDSSKNLPPKVRDYVQRNAAERRQSSIEVRNVDKSFALHPYFRTEMGDIISSKRGKSPQQAHWFRSRAPVKKDPAFQKCILAYASDMAFIGTTARAVGLGSSTSPRLGMLASLDHTMHFYDDSIDVSDFLLYYMESPIVRSGRGVVTGRIYKRDGTLAVICTQEGVVRANL